VDFDAAINFKDDFVGIGPQPFINKNIHASPNKIQNESYKQLKFPNFKLGNTQKSHRRKNSKNPFQNRLGGVSRNGDRPRRRPPQNSSQITF
jgi:hypothetical protein